MLAEMLRLVSGVACSLRDHPNQVFRVVEEDWAARNALIEAFCPDCGHAHTHQVPLEGPQVMARKVWTEEEDGYLRNCIEAGGYTRKAMAEVLGRTVAAVASRAKVLGLTKKRES